MDVQLRGVSSESRIPVVDLFAGPGGLGEGFSSFTINGKHIFRICISIEKEEFAHKTLTTRAFFRQFRPDLVPEAYFRHLRGEISQKEMFDSDENCRLAASKAIDEARQITLGDDPSEPPDQEKRNLVRQLIADRIKGHDTWVLIGGPPCQAYSLAGRSRMLGVVRQRNETESSFRKRKAEAAARFEEDPRQYLYREYLQIIADHWPPVFVMENVRGLLSAQLGGKPVFEMIRRDLENPNEALHRDVGGHTYRIYSLTSSSVECSVSDGSEFLIRAEKYGVPQRRHRVILVGVRADFDVGAPSPLIKSDPPSLSDLISDLPQIFSSVSNPREESLENVLRSIRDSGWLAELGESANSGSDRQKLRQVRALIRETIKHSRIELGKTRWNAGKAATTIARLGFEGKLANWLHDPRVRQPCNHMPRGHMASDLHRYLFVSSYAKIFGYSPKLKDFPADLLPDHKNVKGGSKDLRKFADRFRVQLSHTSAATITCHIAKDGHANIHPDPSQLRSLSVREAARIQTFPDNYFFEGGQTAQYQQVGNAVPPFLAVQIAETIAKLIKRMKRSKTLVAME